MTVTFSAECESVWETMQEANCKDPDYLVCSFKEGEEMDVVASGKGGRAAVVALLDSEMKSSVCTGVFTVTGVDDRSTTVSYRKKLVQFTWVGPETPVMKRARVVSQSGAFVSFFNGATLYLQPSDTDDLSEAEIEKVLRASGGAHQPTSFDFSNDFVKEM